MKTEFFDDDENTSPLPQPTLVPPYDRALYETSISNIYTYGPVAIGETGTVVGEATVTGLSFTHKGSLVALDESDPFESAMAEIVRMFRKKNADYARTGSRWSNFEDMSRFLGDEGKPWLSSLMLCQQKLSRIGALVSSGKEPTNESLIDSLLDNAVYAAMALAMAKDPK